MNCLYQTNASGGFEAQHKFSCGYGACEEPATHHAKVSNNWCANVCSRCADALRKTQRAEITEETYTYHEI